MEHLRERLPDIEIALADGSTLPLHHFCGQKLVVFYCAAGDPEAAAHEIEQYRTRSRSFEEVGAWIIGVVTSAAEAPSQVQGPHVNIGIDEGGAAFAKWKSFLDDPLQISSEDGIAFVIDRDGSIRHAWPRCGHAAEALAMLRERP